MKKLVVMYPCGDEDRERVLEAAGGELGVVFSEKREDILSANAIIGEPAVEEILENERLEWVQLTWAGADRYTSSADFPWERVALCNMSGAFGVAISEYVIGGILAVYRLFPQYWRQQGEQCWRDAGSEETIYGRTVLYLGCGDIGSHVARRLRAFGAYNVGVRRNAAVRPDGFDEMHGMEYIDEGLSHADIVVCSLPDSEGTRGLLNRERLQRMKSDALLVNVGRGTLIDLDALSQLMQGGHLRGAVLDVMQPEPLPVGHPLWSTPRVMLTPHIAGKGIGHCADIRRRIIDICCENIGHYLRGEELKNRV